MDLESILKEYFHCEMPFDKDGNLTENGKYHTERLISLLYGLEEDGIIHDADSAAEQIREIVNEDCDFVNGQKAEYIHDIRTFVEGNPDYKLRDAFEGVYKDGRKVVFRWLEIDHDTDDLFCIIAKEPDETNCVMLSDLAFDSIKELFESIVEFEIDNGWDWEEYAQSVLNEAFPEDSYEDISYFVGNYWETLATDAENIREYKEQRKKQ